VYIKPLNSIVKNLERDKASKLGYYPSKVSIETGNICNLRCPLCPTNSEENKDIPKGFMSFEEFKTIFDKIMPFTGTIDLFSWGEPFLNRDIGRMVRYAKSRKKEIRLFIDSNLNVIDDGMVTDIVEGKLDVLKVSCDGVSQEVYEKYRKEGKIGSVLENIDRINAEKKKRKSSHPELIWKYLVFKHNVHEVEEAKKLAKTKNMGFEVSGMRIDCGKEIFEKVEDSVDRDRSWIPDEAEYNNYEDISGGKDFCGKPWRTMTVNWNGDVVPCGAIYNCSKYSFGNLLEQGFKEVWNSEKFIAARKVIFGEGEVPGLICSICKSNGYQYF